MVKLDHALPLWWIFAQQIPLEYQDIIFIFDNNLQETFTNVSSTLYIFYDPLQAVLSKNTQSRV